MTKVLCLEGITGAGKTTQAKKIDSYLELQDKKYLISSIPTVEYAPIGTEERNKPTDVPIGP